MMPNNGLKLRNVSCSLVGHEHIFQRGLHICDVNDSVECLSIKGIFQINIYYFYFKVINIKSGSFNMIYSFMIVNISIFFSSTTQTCLRLLHDHL